MLATVSDEFRAGLAAGVPFPKRDGVGLGAGGRETRCTDTGVDGKADLQRLAVRPERALDAAGCRYGKR